VDVSMKNVKTKWKYLKDYFQKKMKKVVKPKTGATEQDIPKDFVIAVLQYDAVS
jgi:hypothetical protein